MSAHSDGGLRALCDGDQAPEFTVCKTIRFARNFNIPSEKFAKFTTRSVNTLAQFSEWLDCPGVRL
jgi:hypothetical protein